MSSELARRALAHLDLTSLNDNDNDESAMALCDRAKGPAGLPASVCVWPAFVTLCYENLLGTGVCVAAVINFPDGGTDMGGAMSEARHAINDGADEIDLVWPFRAWLAGDRVLPRQLVEACREAIGDDAVLKVILETGAFPDAAAITEAATAVIACGADFVKTSTGTRQPAATPEAAAAILRAIQQAERPIDAPDRQVGLKVSGDIRGLDQAGHYFDLVDRTMGADWASPETFRIGANGLMDEIEAAIAAAS